MSEATVAIAFPVWEKFGWALPALRRIYAYAAVPFRLYLVDCGYPPAVRAEIDAFLAGRGNVVDIRAPRFLFPSEALNEIVPRVEEPYLSIVHNDVLVHPGWLTRQLETFERFGADIVAPLTYEFHGGRREVHRDEFTDTRIVARDGQIRAQQPRPPGEGPTDPDAPRRVHHFEIHSLTLTAKAARALLPFPYINTHEHLDLAVHAWHKGYTVVHDPRAQVCYMFPPVREYDVPYFRFRWDRKHATHSLVYMCRRWNMPIVPGVFGFVDERNRYAEPGRVRAGVAAGASERDTYEFAPEERVA